MVCSYTGYPYKIEIYAGKQVNEARALGTKVVNNLLSIVKNSLQVFFDNFFTFYDLMIDLVNRNIKTTGTIRVNIEPRNIEVL